MNGTSDLFIKRNNGKGHLAETLLLCVAVAAYSQLSLGDEEANAQQASPVLEEVIVSAQRREQRLMDVSISVTAIGERTLRNAGIFSSNDIGDVVPNVLISAQTLTGNPNIVIRGVSSGAANFAVTPSPAALNVDGVYYTSNAFAAFQLFDLDRIEVLRGPQGTLYGRNTTAGAINYYTATPTVEPTGFLDLTFGSFDHYRVEGALSGSLSDQVQGRISVLSDQNNGYVFNRTSGEDVGDLDVNALRATLDVRPGDTTLIRISGHGFRDRTLPILYDSVGFVGPGCRDLISHGAPVRPGCTDLAGYSDDDGDPFTSEGNAVRDSDNKQYGGYITITHDTSFGLFFSQTSYDYLSRDYLEEQDANAVQFIDITYNEKFKQWSQEFRLSSPDGQKLYWMVGAYYGGNKFNIGRFVPTAFTAFDIEYVNPVDESSVALFAHTEYDLTDRVKLIAGLRNTWDSKKSYVDNRFVIGSTVLTELCDKETCNGDDNWSALSGKLGLDFKVNDELFIYGNYSRGFSSGGFPGGITVNPRNFIQYDPEYVNAYEVGLKSTLFDGSLTANMSAFYYDYKDRKEQALIPPPVTGGTDFVQVFTNAAAVSIYGAEAEFAWQPVERFWVNGSVGYLETEYDTFLLPQGLPGASTLDLTGNDLPFAPRWSIYTAAAYEFPLPGGSRIEAMVDFHYRADLYFTPQNEIITYDPSSVVFGASVNWTSADGRWEAQAFARNISDEWYRENAIVGFGSVFSKYAPPRAYGVSVRYNFPAR